MAKVVVLGAVAAIVFVVGRSHVDDVRGLLHPDVFDAIAARDAQGHDQTQAWDEFAAHANSTCNDRVEAELNFKLAIPRNRREFLHTSEIVLTHEQTKMAALRALEPPSTYDLAYARFLQQRGVGVAALARLREGVATRNRHEAVTALRTMLRMVGQVNPTANSMGMPACIL